jgi:Tfp pilus assembly protein PilN
MIKINLLDSITDTPRGAARVEEKVTSPRIQTLLLAMTVIGLLVLGAGYDYVSAKSAHASAQVELEKQQRINREMLAVNKEQEELAAKTRDIQVRIDAIQKLKASQQGPGYVLRDITERFNSVPALYLTSISLNGTGVTITGESPNEEAVQKFGQILEFSSGLFTDLHIETYRDSAKVAKGADTPSQAGAELGRPEVVNFLVKCNYTGGPKNTAAPATPATAAPAPNAPASQVAKN